MLKLIVICSDKSDNIIFDNLKLILKKSKLCFFAINNSQAEFFKEDDKFGSIILLQTDSINNITDARPDILIFDEGFKIQNYLDKGTVNESENLIALVNDDFDSTIAAFLNEEKYMVVSCGVNPKDTVTISSVTDDTINIFIQRELQTLDLKNIEQQELCIYARDLTNQYALMATAVTAMLLGFKKEFFEKMIF